MKKLITILGCILMTAMGVTTAFAATVPTLNQGDANSTYVPPAGYLYYQVPDSDIEGTHVMTFNSTGAADPAGLYTFAVSIGTEIGETNTKVFSWVSNFPVYAVIVQGDDAYNHYLYGNASTYDNNLIAPDTVGDPTAVAYVSVVFSPAQFPVVPPCTSFGLPFGLILLTAIALILLGIIALLSVITKLILKILILGRGKGKVDIDVDIGNNNDIDIGNKTDINVEKNVVIDKSTDINIEKNINIDIDKCKDDCNHDCHDECHDDRKNHCKDREIVKESDSDIEKTISDYYNSYKNWKKPEDHYK